MRKITRKQQKPSPSQPQKPDIVQDKKSGFLSPDALCLSVGLKEDEKQAKIEQNPNSQFILSKPVGMVSFPPPGEPAQRQAEISLNAKPGSEKRDQDEPKKQNPPQRPDNILNKFSYPNAVGPGEGKAAERHDVINSNQVQNSHQGEETSTNSKYTSTTTQKNQQESHSNPQIGFGYQNPPKTGQNSQFAHVGFTKSADEQAKVQQNPVKNDEQKSVNADQNAKTGQNVKLAGAAPTGPGPKFGADFAFGQQVGIRGFGSAGVTYSREDAKQAGEAKERNVAAKPLREEEKGAIVESKAKRDGEEAEKPLQGNAIPKIVEVKPINLEQSERGIEQLSQEISKQDQNNQQMLAKLNEIQKEQEKVKLEMNQFKGEVMTQIEKLTNNQQTAQNRLDVMEQNMDKLANRMNEQNVMINKNFQILVELMKK